jgi:hypothetical protein
VAVTQVITRDFPHSEDKVKSLVVEHRELKDEPLVLALYYAPDREPQDIFIFEIIDGFGVDSVDPEKNLFEVTYASNAAFPLEQGQKLHLVLTNRKEVKVAFQDGWGGTREIRDAIRRNDYRLIYQDPAAAGLIELIHGQ